MKKIAGLIVILVVLGPVLVYSDEKDDWSFELARVIGDIQNSVRCIEGGIMVTSYLNYLNRDIQKYTELLRVGLERRYITTEQYNQKNEAINAVKRRMLQVIGDRSEGLGL
jgi:hypothetical protein